ncbi:MAG: hypothetical protein ACOY3L_16265 [Pseudomonadota bacterium]
MPPFRRRPGTGFGNPYAPRPGPAAPGLATSPFGPPQLTAAPARGGGSDGSIAGPGTVSPSTWPPLPPSYDKYIDALVTAKPRLTDDDIDRILAYDARRGANEQALNQREQALMTPPNERVPAYLAPPTSMVGRMAYDDIRANIASDPFLTPMERYVFSRLLTYEGLKTDPGRGNTGNKNPDTSRGGLTQKTWDKLQSRVHGLRYEENRDTPSLPSDVTQLSLDDMIDGIRAYASQEFDPKHPAGHPVAEVVNPELAYRLNDIQYQHAPGTRNEIWQDGLTRAVSRLVGAGGSPNALAALPSMAKLAEAMKKREENEARNIHKPSDTDLSELRLQAAAEVATHPEFAKALVRGLQDARAAWWLRKQSEDPKHYRYQGSNRARIWGLTRP